MSRVICALFLFLALTTARAEGQAPNQTPPDQVPLPEELKRSELAKLQKESEEAQERAETMERILRLVLVVLIVLVMAVGGVMAEIGDKLPGPGGDGVLDQGPTGGAPSGDGGAVEGAGPGTARPAEPPEAHPGTQGGTAPSA